MAAKRNLILPQGKRLACRHAQLPFHEIQARNHLGHRMLDLKPGVHFQEIDVQIRIRDELHGARVSVSNRARGLDRVAGQLFAKGRGEHGARRFLDDFLPPPLGRAIALEKVDDVAVRIAENLHFEMARMLDQPLKHERGHRQTRFGLAPRRSKLVAQFGCGANRANPSPSSAADGLYKERKTELSGLGRKPLVGLILAVIAGHARHACSLHDGLCGGLVAHLADDLGRWADEDDSGALASLGEIGILGKKAIAGVDRIRACLSGGFENGWNLEIAFLRGRGADPNRFIRQTHVQSTCIGVGEHRNGPIAHGFRRAGDAASNLAAIGDEYFLEWPKKSLWLRCCFRNEAICRSDLPHTPTAKRRRCQKVYCAFGVAFTASSRFDGLPQW